MTTPIIGTVVVTSFAARAIGVLVRTMTLQVDELGHEVLRSLRLIDCEPRFDDDALILDVPFLAQSGAEFRKLEPERWDGAQGMRLGAPRRAALFQAAGPRRRAIPARTVIVPTTNVRRLVIE